jgi:hypothetical protein
MRMKVPLHDAFFYAFRARSARTCKCEVLYSCRSWKTHTTHFVCFYVCMCICMYCDVLPGKASVIIGFWILYLDLLDKSSGGIYS